MVLDGGYCAYTGLSNGRLKSLIDGRGGGLTNQIDILSVVESNDGEMYYYISFMDGKAYWDFGGHFLDEIVMDIMDMGNVKKISLGLSSYGELQYAVEATDGTLYYDVDGVHHSWFSDGWTECSLGSCGEYFVQVRGGGEGNFIHSYLPTNQFREVRSLGNRVQRLFISNGNLVMTYS